MEKSEKKNSMMKQSVFILFISLIIILFIFDSMGHAKWEFGIGTGLSRMETEGVQGFHTDLAGPVEFDIELDPEDFDDLIDTAIGFGGYATNGTFLIQYSYANLQLEGRESEAVPAINSTLSVEIDFDITQAELTVGYPVYGTRSLIIFVDGGLRYIRHEFDGSLSLINSGGAVVGSESEHFDHDWTDVILGVIINVPLAEKWSWNNRLNAGFGGSEGTYFAATGVTWRFHKNLSVGVTGKYTAIDFENDNKGDSDWYLYDADESSVGINVVFIF